MIVSRACPIEFWVNGVPTFNEKVNPGVQSIPYYPKFQLTDAIRIQVLNPDDDDRELNLCAYDCDGARVATQAFTAYDGYYETEFTFSILGLAAGAYRLQIETPYVLTAGVGVFSITGQSAALGGEFSIEAVVGLFNLTFQEVTTTIRHGVLNLQATLTEAFGAQEFDIDFEGTLLTLIGNGASDANTMEFDATVDVSVGKVTNGGIAQDAGIVLYKKNGSTVSSQAFNVGDNISGLGYSYTGLASGDVLLVEIYEG